MPKYLVCSPTYPRLEEILDGWPRYVDGCSCWEGEAPNEREARKLALRDPDFAEWVQQQRDSNRNPFAGLRVDLAAKEDDG